MSSPVVLPPESEKPSPPDPSRRQLSPIPADEPDFDTYQSLTRLLVGGLLAGSDLLLARLRSWEAAIEAGVIRVDAGENTGDLTRHMLVGLIFESAGLARRAAASSLRIGSSAGRFGLAVLRPFTTGNPIGPVRRRSQAAIQEHQARLTRLADIGRQEEPRSRRLAEAFFTETIDEVVALLSDSAAVARLIREQVDALLPELAQDPGIDALVREVADRYVAYLRENPAQVANLIREQGDAYIEYLNEHPDNVQDLIQGQSLGLAEELMDEVRERTVTADTVAEAIVRRVLRRVPRSELPEPGERIQRRAQNPRLPSDFARR